MKRPGLTERCVWGAKWPNGDIEVEVLPFYECMRRRDLAIGLGGPSRVSIGRITRKNPEPQAVAFMREHLANA